MKRKPERTIDMSDYPHSTRRIAIQYEPEKKPEMQFLCMSPLSKQILPLLQNYAEISGEDTVFELVTKDYTIFCSSEVTPKRLNEYRMYAMGCYDTMRMKGL
jgi:hypothetical protein